MPRKTPRHLLPAQTTLHSARSCTVKQHASMQPSRSMFGRLKLGSPSQTCTSRITVAQDQQVKWSMWQFLRAPVSTVCCSLKVCTLISTLHVQDELAHDSSTTCTNLLHVFPKPESGQHGHGMNMRFPPHLQRHLPERDTLTS